MGTVDLLVGPLVDARTTAITSCRARRRKPAPRHCGRSAAARPASGPRHSSCRGRRPRYGDHRKTAIRTGCAAAGGVIGQIAATARGRLDLRSHARPGVGVRVIDVCPLLVPSPPKTTTTTVLAVPGSDERRGWGVGGAGREVAPAVRGQIVAPDDAVVEVVLTEPVPAVTAAEGGEADEAAAGGIEDVLLGTADARAATDSALLTPIS